MQNMRSKEELKSLIKSHLFKLIADDEKFHSYVIKITDKVYAGKKKTEDRIDRILDELKTTREFQEKKWEENHKKWEESSKKWEENSKKWEESNKKLIEIGKRTDKSIEEFGAERIENNKRWEENQRVINANLAEVQKLNKRLDSSIGALGARWGLHSEESFRGGLKAILEQSFKVTVERYLDRDDEGSVFGRPDQVELDVIIRNGDIILCELKSSMSKSDVYTFWRKKEFYEKRHNKTVKRLIIISPMVDPKALKIAKDMGIEVYSYSDSVAEL